MLIGLVSTPVLGQIISWLRYSPELPFLGGVIYTQNNIFPESHPEALALAVSDFLRDCIISVMLWHFYCVFKNIRLGAVFVVKQTRNIAVSGWCFITLSLYSIISDMALSLAQSQGGTLHYYFQVNNVIYIPIGIGLIILSYVLKLATAIKEEQELVI